MLMNYPTETEHEAMGQRQLTEDHGKVIFASVFFFFFAAIHPTFKHAPWKESTIKERCVDDLELFDGQRRKSARIIWFLSSPWSGFRQSSTACKSDDLSSNEECFSSEIWEIAVFLYNWLASPWEFLDKTGTWKVEQKTTVARPWS